MRNTLKRGNGVLIGGNCSRSGQHVFAFVSCGELVSYDQNYKYIEKYLKLKSYGDGKSSDRKFIVH